MRWRQSRSSVYSQTSELWSRDLIVLSPPWPVLAISHIKYSYGEISSISQRNVRLLKMNQQESVVNNLKLYFEQSYHQLTSANKSKSTCQQTVDFILDWLWRFSEQWVLPTYLHIVTLKVYVSGKCYLLCRKTNLIKIISKHHRLEEQTLHPPLQARLNRRELKLELLAWRHQSLVI